MHRYYPQGIGPPSANGLFHLIQALLGVCLIAGVWEASCAYSALFLEDISLGQSGSLILSYDSCLLCQLLMQRCCRCQSQIEKYLVPRKLPPIPGPECSRVTLLGTQNTTCSFGWGLSCQSPGPCNKDSTFSGAPARHSIFRRSGRKPWDQRCRGPRQPAPHPATKLKTGLMLSPGSMPANL